MVLRARQRRCRPAPDTDVIIPPRPSTAVITRAQLSPTTSRRSSGSDPSACSWPATASANRKRELWRLRKTPLAARIITVGGSPGLLASGTKSPSLAETARSLTIRSGYRRHGGSRGTGRLPLEQPKSGELLCVGGSLGRHLEEDEVGPAFFGSS